MAGIRIDVDTSGAVTDVKKLAKGLEDLGRQGASTEAEVKKLTAEVKKSFASEEAARASAKLTAALGSLETACHSVTRGITEVGTRANATGRHMDSFSRDADNMQSKMGALVTKIGLAAAAYVTFGQAVSAASNSSAAFREYESALTDMGRVSNDSLQSIDKLIKGMSRELGDPTSQMKAYYQILSAGVTDSAKAMDMLTVSAKTSKAAHVEQEQVVKGLTKLMAGYDGAIKSAAEASDLLFRIDNLGQTSVAELVPVIGDIAAVSKLAGLSSAEMASGLALVTQTSGSTAEAATKMKAIAIGLYKPTENMAKVLKALGYESGTAMVKQEGLAGALKILQSVADTAHVSLGKMFESSEALVGVAALGANGWGTYSETLKKMGEGANETEEAFKRWEQTSQQVKDTYDATIKTLSIEFGQELAPLMTRGMQGFVDTVTQNKGTVTETFKSIASAAKMAVDAILDLAAAWNKLPPAIQGAIMGGGMGALLSKGNPYVMAVGAAVGANEMVEAMKPLNEQVTTATQNLDELKKRKDVWANTFGKSTGTFDKEIADREKDLSALVQQAKTAGVEVVESVDKTTSAMKTAKIYRGGENKGTIPELATMFPDAGKAADGISQVTEATKKGTDATNKNTAANDKARVSQEKLDAAAKALAAKGKKGGSGAADAAERYTAAAETFYDNTMYSIDQLNDSMTGGTEKTANRVDKFYEGVFNSIRQKVIGAKGDVSALAATWVAAEAAWDPSKKLAVLIDTTAELRKQAQLLKDIGDATGDPELKEKAGIAEVTAWYKDKEKIIASSNASEEEKAELSAALQRGRDAKLLKSKAEAYAGIKGVSSEYWAAEKQLIESNLASVKAKADDETAYKIYAAQQWDAFYKSQMESQAANAGSFAETLSAKWSLAFGGYKDETTKTKESWDNMSDSIIKASDGMVEGIAGGFGDMIRNIGNGTASIEDLWKNMLARMLDMFASFVEDMIKSQLKDMLSGMFKSGGSDSKSGGLDLSSLFGGSSSSSSSSSSGGSKSGGFDLSSLSDLFSSKSSSSTSSGSAWDASSIRLLGSAVGEKSGATFTEALTDGTGALTFDLGNTADIGKDITKSLSKYGNVYDAASNTSSYSNWQAGSLMGSKTTGSTAAVSGNYLGGGMAAIGGIAQMATSTSTMGTIGGGLMTAGGVMMMIPSGVTQVIGGIMVAGGALLSAFGSEKKEEKKKTASGYSVGYSGGHASASGVDFYSDGSTVSTGASDPDVQKKISDAFKDTAEALSDFADELGITVDILDNFSFPSMDITTDQLDGYIRNGENQMAFQSLLENGLRGAFDAVLEDGEIYVDEYERLATSSKAVVGQFEGYGYAMQDVAKITQEQIDALREKNTEVANGTAQALATMAAAMGGSSSLVSQLASDTTIANAALEVTDEQLLAILEADYSSKLLDAVGGEDALKSIMGNLTKNAFKTVESYAANLDYYYAKANKTITKIGDTSVTIANFWEKFDEAVKGGLTVEEFEAWGKASEWIDNIDSVVDALETWNNSMKKVSQSLDARAQKASGQDDQATVTQAYSTAEWELYDAQKANYDMDVLQKLQLTEYLELQRAEFELTKKKMQASEDLIVRDMEIDDSPFSSAIAAIYDNAWEYQEAAQSGLYTADGLAYLKSIQDKEVQKYYDDVADEIQTIMDDLSGQVNEAQESEMWNWLDALTEAMSDSTDEAKRLGATEQQLADIRQAETDLISAKLKETMDSVQDSVDSDLLTEMESWYKDLAEAMAQSAEDAALLGASEQQLSDIRQAETDLIAKKLSTMMEGIMEELSTMDGTELEYSVKSLKKTMGESMYEAALLGASETDLTNVGMLYAYKIKSAYQTQIDEIVSQLESAASALESFSDSLKDFLEGLWTDEDSPLSLKGRYEEASSQWKSTVTDLGSTDKDIKAKAQGKIESMTSTYLELSKEYNSDFSAYYSDFMTVQSILGEQYKQSKSEYEIITEQLKAVEDTKDNTKTTAELLDQLKTLQKDQGDTWTKMLSDLPTQIAEAIRKAEEYKNTVKAGINGGGGGSKSLSYQMGDGKGGWIDYGTADSWDAAYSKSEQQYLEAKTAQINAAGGDGKVWTVNDTVNAITAAGLTPYEHFFNYGGGEINSATGERLSWGNGPTSTAIRNVSTGGETYTSNDVLGRDSSSAFDVSSYIAAKTAQLNKDDYQTRTWTAAETAAAISSAGLTPAQHYAQYGQYENLAGYADGGYIPGYSSSDTLIAKLRLGEFVMKPEAVNHYGVDFMEALNGRALPGFASGGVAGRDTLAGPIRTLGVSSGSGDGQEATALRQEVVQLRETVSNMSTRMDKLLSRLVVNSDGAAINGVKVQVA